jgi:hypothetical protein
MLNPLAITDRIVPGRIPRYKPVYHVRVAQHTQTRMALLQTRTHDSSVCEHLMPNALPKTRIFYGRDGSSRLHLVLKHLQWPHNPESGRSCTRRGAELPKRAVEHSRMLATEVVDDDKVPEQYLSTELGMGSQ